VHRFLEQIALGKTVDESLKTVDAEHVALCRLIDVEGLFAGIVNPRPELAYAIDLETRKVRYIGQSIGRVYGNKSKYELVGSCDLMAERTSDGMKICRDWKSGAHHGPRSLQQMFFAAVAILEGADSVLSQVVAIESEGPRMGSHEILEAEVGLFDVEAYLDDMWAAAKRTEQEETRYKETGDVRVNVGDHCSWCGCRSAGSCPAYAGLAKAMVADLTTLADRITALTPEQAGGAWLKYREAESLIDLIGKGLKGYCGDGTIPLPDGREVRAQQQSRSSLSKDALLELAQRLGATAADINGCFRSNKFNVYKIRKKDS
jgi:PD-(D/E)XK nuclease superfamily